MDTLASLKKTIREEIEKIWVNEPDDVAAIRLGFFPSGAGVYNQHFTVLIMLGSEARSLAIHTFSGLIAFADSGKFSLDQLKYLTKEMLRMTSGVMGYFGLRRFGDILDSFLKHLDEVDSITELHDLFEDLFTLTNRYQMWLYQTFPWYLSVLFPKKTPEDAQEYFSIAEKLKKEGFY